MTYEASGYEHGTLHRTADQSADGAAQTVTRRGPCYVKQVSVTWPGQVTAEVKIELDSGAGEAYDARLATITFAGSTYAVWRPDYDLMLLSDDVLLVKCPAVGGAKSAVLILTEVR